MAPTNFSPADTSNQKLNSEISDEIHAAIAYLTRPFQQLHTLHTPRDENNQNQEAGKDLEAGQVEDGVGVRIITLAGQNSGATMNLPGSSQNTIDAGEGGQRESVVSSNHTTINIHINNNIKEVNNSILYNCSSKFRYPVVRLPEFHIDINNNIQELNNSIFYNSSCGFRYPGVCPDVSMGRKRLLTEFLNSAVDVDDFLNSGVDVDDQASCSKMQFRAIRMSVAAQSRVLIRGPASKVQFRAIRMSVAAQSRVLTLKISASPAQREAGALILSLGIPITQNL